MKIFERAFAQFTGIADQNRNLLESQIRRVFEELDKAFTTNVVVVAAVAGILLVYLPAPVGILWLVMFSAILGWRWHETRQVLGETPGGASVLPSRRFHSILTLHGLAWGSLTWLSLPYNIDLGIFLLVVVAIVSITSIAFLSYYLPAFLAHLTAISLPSLAFMLVAMPEYRFAALLLYLLFLVIVMRTVADLNRSNTRRLVLEQETKDLNVQLEARNRALETELVRHQETASTLRKNEQYLDAVFDNAPIEIFLKDIEGRYIKVSRSFEKSYHTSANAVIGKKPDEIFTPAYAKHVMQQDRDVIESGSTIIREEAASLESEYGNHPHTLLTVKFPLFDDDSRAIGIGAFATDISERKQIENKLKLDHYRFRDFARTAADYYWETTPSGEITFSSDDRGMLNGVPIADIVRFGRHEYAEGRLVVNKVVAEQANRVKRRKTFELDFSFKLSNGPEVRIFLRGLPISDSSGNFAGYRGIARDITREYHLKQDIAYQANHDDLTGQYNRRHFLTLLENRIDDARHRNVTHALCYVDLDRFKHVNDTVGHMAGDYLLRQVAGLISRYLGTDDILGRLGGDEFGIIMADCSVNDASDKVQRILNAIHQGDFQWDGQNFHISASFGISRIDSQTGSATEILSDADQACYKAKADDEGGRFISTRRGDSRQQGHYYRYKDWSRAFEEERIRLYAQPIYAMDCINQDPSWFEILIRLIDDSDTPHSPASFIPFAEHYGQMARIDQWVIERSLAQISKFENQVSRFSINLSASSLHNDRLRAQTFGLIRDSGINPARICFELTETSAVRNLGIARNFVTRIRNEGCLIALDDFGTGMSSFSYLQNFPVDYLKIDGSFVRDVENDRYNAVFVESIVKIAHTMKIGTIAENVENEKCIPTLREAGVHYLQGYGLGRPIPLSDADTQ